MAFEEELHSTLGETIRQQRMLAQLPMRQLATMVGISNPYLSQIERGLRAPSEQVLDAIAESLQVSADSLHAYSDADGDGDEPPVLEAIREDARLTAGQRQALTELYLACVDATTLRRRRGGGDT